MSGLILVRYSSFLIDLQYAAMFKRRVLDASKNLSDLSIEASLVANNPESKSNSRAYFL